MESEGEGITIFWKIENINLIPKERCFTIEFNWPHSEKKGKVALHLSSLRIEKIFLFAKEKYDFEQVSGTLFAKTGEESLYDIGRVENWNTLVETSKRFNLVNVENLFLKFEFQKDVLELRIHLWNNRTTKIKQVQYYFRSHILNQKLSLPWTIKSEVDKNLNEVFLHYETDLNIEFLNELAKQTCSPKIFLQFQNFLTSSATCQAGLMDVVDGDYILKCLLTVEDGEKKQVSFGKIDRFQEYTGKFNIPICMPVEELKARKAEFYPDGELCLTCNFTIFSALSVLERGHYGFDENHFDWQRDDGESLEGTPTSVEEDMTLNDSICSVYKDGNICDVSLRSGDTSFPCHKIVLCARSPVFRAMFDNDMREKKSSVVDIDDADPHTLRLFLDSLYTDSLAVMTFDSVLNLYVISDKYEVVPVRKRCAAFIRRYITLSNVCEVLILADRYQDQSLIKAVHLFFSKNAKKIVDSPDFLELMQINPLLAAETMREALLKYWQQICLQR